jgi:PilZ domain
VSRIWRELKQAERVKSHTTLCDDPKIEASNSSGENCESDPLATGATAGTAHPAGKGSTVADRRATRRRGHQFPLLVYGSDAEKQPFHEEIETLDISEDGCSFDLENVVARGQRLFLANKVNQAELAARVVHVGRRAKDKSRIGVEFLRSAPEFWLAD